jgi:hypothetical protein
MQASRRHCICASLALLALFAAAPRTHAETLTITSTPAGATVEIGGMVAGTTPYETDYPGGYFHKTHTVFGARLEHSLVVRVSKDGYLTQEVTLTMGPFDWVGLTGRHHGDYFLLRSSHFDIKLEPTSRGDGKVVETIGKDGPMRRAPAAALLSDNSAESNGAESPSETGTIEFASDPSGADIYVDGKFMGQTPSTIRLASGSHHIEMTSPGRQVWARDLDVLKDSHVTVHPVLEPSP